MVGGARFDQAGTYHSTSYSTNPFGVAAVQSMFDTYLHTYRSVTAAPPQRCGSPTFPLQVELGKSPHAPSRACRVHRRSCPRGSSELRRSSPCKIPTYLPTKVMQKFGNSSYEVRLEMSDRGEQLYHAAQFGKMPELRRLLEEGVRPDEFRDAVPRSRRPRRLPAALTRPPVAVWVHRAVGGRSQRSHRGRGPPAHQRGEHQPCE